MELKWIDDQNYVDAIEANNLLNFVKTVVMWTVYSFSLVCANEYLNWKAFE